MDSESEALEDRFRAAFRRHSTTVTVLSYVASDGTPKGLTATSVASLSIAPPSLIASLNRASNSRSEILAAGRFGVNVLGLAQEEIAAHCAVAGGDKRLRREWLLPVDGAATPVLRGALAHFDCHIARVHEEYTHSLVVAEVDAVWLGTEGAPLIYSAGAYRTLDGHDPAAQAEWTRVLSTYL